MTPTLLYSSSRITRVRFVWIQTHASETFGPFIDERPADEDILAYLATHAVALLGSLVGRETGEALSLISQSGSEAVLPPFKYTTQSDALSALRVFYATATRLEAIMVGDYLSSLGDAVLRNLFNITQAQLNTLRTNKLTPAANIATSIRAASGA